MKPGRVEKKIEEERKYFHYEPLQKREEPERYRAVSEQSQTQFLLTTKKQIQDPPRKIPVSYPTIPATVLKEKKNDL